MKIQDIILSLVILLTCEMRGLAQSVPGSVLWTYDAAALIRSSPAVTPEGTVYLEANGWLYAITNRGSNQWTITLGGNNCGSPAVALDGTIYIPSGSAGKVYAFRPDGTPRWSFQTGGGNASAALGRDGTIYTFGYVVLHALSAAGLEKWQYPIGGTSVFSSPSLDPSGFVYVLSPELNLLYQLSSAGTQQWTFSFDNAPGESLALGIDGTAYVAAGSLFAVSVAGTQLWATETNDFRRCSPVIAEDGTVCIATSHGSLCAFKPSGNFKWQVLTNGYTPGTTPAIDSVGTIYYVAYSVLYAISPAGNVIWSVPLIRDPGDVFGTSMTSPAIGPDGTIYVTSANRLYAIFNTNKLADSPWPMYRQNARHTGKIEKPFLTQPKKRIDNNFQFQMQAQLGGTNVIEASTNLTTWTAITNVVITNVPMDVVDLKASKFTSRFYRALSP